MTLSGKLQIKPGHTVVVLSPPDDVELGLDRASLAALLTARGMRPVRQIALDETWSALRFRPGG